ncbi:MAG: GAF domain-containing protein [Spirochaetes bacterium]|nr:GAF domain-containing protein [Spirochaetota bacterium]
MKNENIKFAALKAKGENHEIFVPVSSNKSEIPKELFEKWQKISDLTAKIVNVPSALITYFTEKNLEVLIASNTAGNPYKQDDKDSLSIGMFCETVLANNRSMCVQNIDKDDFWKNNPHAVTGMKSYMGVPIKWEDGEMFGTFCLLDSKTDKFTDDYLELLLQFKDIIESDLKSILLTEELKSQILARELSIKEAHHTIKNHFSMILSYMQMQSIMPAAEVKSVLKDLQSRIHALSTFHEKLYKSHDGLTASLDAYISELCKIILKQLVCTESRLIVNIDNIVLKRNVSVQIGLIISELLNNSIKYAFTDCDETEVSIEIKKNDNKLSIIYKDNGKGYPDIISTDQKDSLGLYIVKIMTEQLGGEMKIGNNNGAQYSTVIPLP